MPKTTTRKTFTVLRDTQEQRPWHFQVTEFCRGVIEQKLPTGDYTLAGLEGRFVIERKGSVLEWAKNINEERFEEELHRLDQMDHPFIFLEFLPSDIMTFPRSCRLSLEQKKKLRVSGPYLLRRTWEIQTAYRVKVCHVGRYGQENALSLFKRMAELLPDE